VSEPVIPAGNGPAGSGAKGFASSLSGAFVASGDGDAVGVCANVETARPEHKTSDANIKRSAI